MNGPDTLSRVKVQLLGPLRVLTDDGNDLAPRARKQRAVLTLLALRVGSVVRVSDLIDALWGDEPVESVSSLVKGYISDLRKALGRDTIVTEAGGYRLAISADDVDVTEFEKLMQSSANAMEAGDPRRALDLFKEATFLWRGPPLPDLGDQLTGQAEATHLKEWYEAGLERSFDARLALGESESLIADLESAVAEEPYRERRWEQLMLALYRAGRRTEAQRAFQRLWKALEEVGGEPREQATALDRAMAVQDPSLQWVAPAITEVREADARFPSGNLTFLFTDIEGSTGLALRLGAQYREVLEEHRHLLRSSVTSHGGTEVDTAGDGSFIVFDDAGQALGACLEAQIALRMKKWPPGNEVRVRMGLHTGIARLADGGYMGPSVHEAARICDAGHGGQVLLSAETARIARGFLPEGSSLSYRGSFMLRGFEEPEQIFQLLHPEMNSSFPPLKASLAQSHNLPDTQTTFVGRELELKELGDLLSESRVVTVVGPGGVGKTRLAVEFGARLAPHYERGIRLCDLSPLDDPTRVPSSLAASFGIRDEPGSDPVGSVAEALSGHEALLLIDSCEHLVESAGAAIKALTATVPGLKVLATSRRNLGLEGERVLRIQPLETPVAGASFEAVTDCEAVRLFENRARLVQSAFEVRDDNVETVGEICRQLEGVPLSIELAAAQVSSLPLSAIADRLGSGFKVEKPTMQPASERHRTLEATVDWSYRLLDDRAQRFLRFLSVFANGFTLDAARAISDEEDPIEILTTLVDASLVVWDPDAARYRLLETIRSFARARLEELGEQDVAGSRHLAWCAAFADSMQTDRHRNDSYEVFERELDNFRAALRWAANRESRSTTGEREEQYPIGPTRTQPRTAQETASDAARLADAIQQPMAPDHHEARPAISRSDLGSAWELEVAPDRNYFDRMDTEGVAFPGESAPQRFGLAGELVTVGRRAGGVVPEIDLSTSPVDTGISRDHAWLIRQSDGGWSIVDPGSTNGIYLNDTDQTLPLGLMTRLEDGDRVHIGAWTTITVRHAGNTGP